MSTLKGSFEKTNINSSSHRSPLLNQGTGVLWEASWEYYVQYPSVTLFYCESLHVLMNISIVIRRETLSEAFGLHCRGL